MVRGVICYLRHPNNCTERVVCPCLERGRVVEILESVVDLCLLWDEGVELLACFRSVKLCVFQRGGRRQQRCLPDDIRGHSVCRGEGDECYGEHGPFEVAVGEVEVVEVEVNPGSSDSVQRIQVRCTLRQRGLNCRDAYGHCPPPDVGERCMWTPAAVRIPWQASAVSGVAACSPLSVASQLLISRKLWSLS